MNKALNKIRRKYIGLLLQGERDCLQLEQVDLARILGKRQESISRIEAGSRRIDILELIKYAEALGFSITEIAWKIETYLSALRLLPLPKRNVLEKKIRVEVSRCENGFSASFGEIVPETIVFTADNFVELQLEVEEGLNSYVKGMVADGYKEPRWLTKKVYEFEYRFLDATSLLNAYSPYITLAAISRVSGINQNLLSQYAKGLKNAGSNQLKRIAETIHKIGKELTAVVV